MCVKAHSGVSWIMFVGSGLPQAKWQMRGIRHTARTRLVSSSRLDPDLESARSLFFRAADQYAFGEEAWKDNLEAFAVQGN